VGTVTASRYNGAGHDVRLTLQGSEASVQVGLDARAALRSTEPGVNFPDGTPHAHFAGRFSAAYREEMRAFMGLIRQERANPCPPEDAVAASRVADAAQASLMTGLPVTVAGSDIDPGRSSS
jgi:myo-inositol 2-dehydrogenase / D-chiro-inositol 1-dehydrogenase